MSIAKSRPEKLRSLENPYGSETDPEVRHYNAMLTHVVRFASRLLAKGAAVMFENLFVELLFLS